MANEKLYEDMEPREKFEALWLKAGLHKRPGADALLYDLEKQGFFDLPASIKHHSNRFGGLATHTVNVADTAMELCETNHAFKDCDKNAVLVAALRQRTLCIFRTEQGSREMLHSCRKI